MVLTHCFLGWTVWTVLGLCLPVWSAVKVIQPYRVVSTNGTAQVQCFIHPQPSNHQTQPSDSPRYPYPDPEELRVTLVKGLHSSEELCSSILIITGQNETGVKKGGELQCWAQVTDGAVEVTVSGLKPADTDIYRCEIEIFYPPPYLRLTGNGTLIHILDNTECPQQEAESQTAHQRDEEEAQEVDETVAQISIPVVVLVILIIFVLIIIIYFQTFQCEQGKREVVRTVPGNAHKVEAVAFSYENIA